MISTWFECKVKYTIIDENGREKKVNAPYLLDAVSFTEAETRIIQEMKKYCSGEFDVTNINKTNYSEIVPNGEGDRWFKSQVAFFMVDEERGIEKSSKTTIIVEGDSVENANENLKEHLKDTLVNYEIKSVSETAILDIFPYFSEEISKE